MNRRKFLTAVAATPLVARTAFLSPRDIGAAEYLSIQGSKTTGWRQFEITTRVNLPAGAGDAQLWLPLAQTAGDYQTALDLRWKSTGDTKRVHDARYGAPILFTEWNSSDADKPRQIEVVQAVATQDRVPSSFQPLTDAERKFWTTSTPSAPVDGIVRDTAARITAGLREPRERLRAIYDWVINHTHRDPDTPGCGRGDIQTMLQLGQLGGKCADINSLMVGLARATGFPARDVYGIRVADSRLLPCLGRSGNVSGAQHCRAEVFLDDEGWFPVDPADVRKVMLEGKNTLDDAASRTLRDRLFGSWEMNWVGYNSATDIELPCIGSQKPAFAFLMYPCGFVADRECPCLNPNQFHYEITSRELVV